MGEEYTEHFEVTFAPARSCAYCDELTSQGIGETQTNYRDFVVLPLCPQHGYVAPQIGGPLAEYASIERFICWFHDRRGRAHVVGPVEVTEIDGWKEVQAERPVKTDVQQLKAWKVQHTDRYGTSECYVVLDETRHYLEYYEANEGEKKESKPMNEQQQNRMNLFNQYRQAYGDLATEGNYNVGDRVYFDGGSVGEIIWKYQSSDGLTYVLDDNTGFPEEVQASDIEGRV